MLVVNYVELSPRYMSLIITWYVIWSSTRASYASGNRNNYIPYSYDGLCDLWLYIVLKPNKQVRAVDLMRETTPGHVSWMPQCRITDIDRWPCERPLQADVMIDVTSTSRVRSHVIWRLSATVCKRASLQKHGAAFIDGIDQSERRKNHD